MLNLLRKIYTHITGGEYILCAAIVVPGVIPTHKVKNCNHLVVCGHRHHNCFETLSLLSSLNSDLHKRVGHEEQGFLTNRNRFVNREVGAIIALNAGQIIRPCNKYLFSENLW